MTALIIAAVTSLASCSKDVPPSAFITDHAAWVALPDEDAQRAQAKILIDKWRGQRVRWPALAVAGLCVKKAATPAAGETQRCAMNPFARSGADADAAASLGGVFPLYRFDAVTFAALKEQCAGLDRCVVDVDATIAEVRLDPDEPLAIILDVRAVNAGRAPTDKDGWARPKMPTTQKNPSAPLKLPPVTPTPAPTPAKPGATAAPSLTLPAVTF